MITITVIGIFTLLLEVDRNHEIKLFSEYGKALEKLVFLKRLTGNDSNTCTADNLRDKSKPGRLIGINDSRTMGPRVCDEENSE